ncbi:hypothetical protein AVEN_76541-1 [Araneus ventricosus]|uniref:Transposase IS30-like HTH domain-containing protein n=1 Tax=Araneus ventricosus TaxID=182803 RepID=A0A4Y2CFE1_ARAVE|nr:hypothetical protein AVEN_76541-1 [Araneus ventricosus]
MVGMLYRNDVDLILNPILPKVKILEFARFTNPITVEAYTILSGKKTEEAGFFLYFSVLHYTNIGNQDVDSEPNKYVVRKGKRSFVQRFKMPKASPLSNEEVSKILHLKLLCQTVKKISKLLNRSKSMIYRVLTRKTPYETKPRSGRPRVTDIHSDRRIQRMSSKSENVGSRNY